METFKILWGTTWRGGAFGLLAGTMGGAAREAGAIFPDLFLVAGLVSENSFQPSDTGALVGGVLFFALIGAVMGALFGVPTGLVVGLWDGLLVGLITRAFFFPLKDVQTYRRVIAITCVVFTTIASWLGFLAIMLFYANRDKANVPALAVGAIIPALIAGIAAGLISRLIAR